MARKKSKKQKVDKKKNPLSADSDSDSFASLSDSDKIQNLLEPYSKEQLIEFISDAALTESALLSLIRSTADRDVSHRKIFVHGFPWDTTRETLLSAFQSYGDVEDCNVILDKGTGRAKGFGFVLFKSRAAAAKALKQPQKKIGNRTAFCQLASVGPPSMSAQGGDTSGRKIFVSNVDSGVDPDRLRDFFARFGEIETGPMGFDQSTGKSRGFALFLYKTSEGARKALEVPYKVFEGRQLHCSLAAADAAQKAKPAAIPGVPQLPGPAALAAAAAAQNLALFTQNPSLNPAFNALIGNSSSGLMSGNSLLPGYGTGLSGLSGSPSVLGPYGMQGQAAAHLGQSSGASLSGIPPYML